MLISSACQPVPAPTSGMRAVATESPAFLMITPRASVLSPIATR